MVKRSCLCKGSYLTTKYATVSASCCMYFAYTTECSVWVNPADYGPGGYDYASTSHPIEISIPANASGISITATGSWYHSHIYPNCGPSGQSYSETTLDVYRTSNCSSNLIPSHSSNVSKLIGMWSTGTPSNNDEIFDIGDGTTVSIPAWANKLFLAHHDGWSWNDNSGSVEVTLVFSC